MSTVYRREPSRSGSGFVVNYTATAYKQSCANRKKELQIFQSSHYGGLSEAQKRNTYLLGFGGLAIMVLSVATGGITLYFGGPGKAVVVYLATCLFGMTGVVVNCEKEY